jgi:hypothetical protein
MSNISLLLMQQRHFYAQFSKANLSLWLKKKTQLHVALAHNIKKKKKDCGFRICG